MLITFLSVESKETEVQNQKIITKFGKAEKENEWSPKINNDHAFTRLDVTRENSTDLNYIVNLSHISDVNAKL